MHKETPAQGGDYPFHLTSGHPRWSIHSMNMTNKIMLNTHRGHRSSTSTWRTPPASGLRTAAKSSW